MQNNKDKGYVWVPYIFKNIKTDINGETVWYANKWKNVLLKIKRFFYKSKNLRNSNKYLNKKVNSSFYVEITITNKENH